MISRASIYYSWIADGGRVHTARQGNNCTALLVNLITAVGSLGLCPHLRHPYQNVSLSSLRSSSTFLGRRKRNVRNVSIWFISRVVLHSYSIACFTTTLTINKRFNALVCGNTLAARLYAALDHEQLQYFVEVAYWTE